MLILKHICQDIPPQFTYIFDQAGQSLAAASFLSDLQCFTGALDPRISSYPPPPPPPNCFQTFKFILLKSSDGGLYRIHLVSWVSFKMFDKNTNLASRI